MRDEGLAPKCHHADAHHAVSEWDLPRDGDLMIL